MIFKSAIEQMFKYTKEEYHIDQILKYAKEAYEKGFNTYRFSSNPYLDLDVESERYITELKARLEKEYEEFKEEI